ncbi:MULTISPECIES: LacI family DNA-binding transcriptional regulator [unclassified Mesorhizobium]|uniref:LacI family DNA-binding transcriptional regulator n=1 Tax=unclassified Mesorhizobium TaxID=325217 RepID=UPI0003CEDF6D|nr:MULTISPECIES: LacI family DNA-binding transcriptional regulator [unclassified Mesorhizobium]ESX96484.1 transcriptional regulator [Mesorhizobium sp. LNJC403B00]ESY06317.1 transcriptional regulator [Mesorhizobium sp. LNJC399B00]ESY56326.1 transcriptional regulator [Mesorhizobium sp. LNJC374B00]ESY60934.1 transcriptional regulator [Mesorhizobium sp. LNJC372A00]ESZ63002.1 transcriptional regulator [Mesorhizobium sp. L103C131B0]
MVTPTTGNRSAHTRGAVATIADVARLAGVSRAAASRALSSGPRPVSADKRERVVQAAAQLGYKPNLLAQSLTTKTVNLVAVVVNHIHDLSDLDLFDRLLDAIQSIGKQVILIRIGSAEGVEDFLRNGVAYHVDAAVVFSDFADAATVRRMFRSDLVIMLNGLHDDLSPTVIPDEGVGIAEAVADAAAKRARTASLLTGRSSSRVEQLRIGHYLEAFRHHGIELLQTVQGDYSYESGYAAAAGLTGRGCPDAVFCTSDAMAMGVLDVCRADFPDNRPSRFRLYGFDNVSLTNFDAYPISSIGYDKSDYVGHIVGALSNPQVFMPGQPPVVILTRLISRLTA